MAAEICPTITASEPHAFREQVEEVADFAVRLHIDISDGTLAPNQLLAVDRIWWPGGVRADLHVMAVQPFQHIELYKALGPQLVIVHAEAEGDFDAFAAEMHRHGIETGVALLAETPVSLIESALDKIDHVLIFSGTLGHFGGTADLSLLDKVAQLKRLKPQLEIGWDGGVSLQNASQLAAGGVEVLNAGGAVHKAADPAAAFAALTAVL